MIIQFWCSAKTKITKTHTGPPQHMADFTDLSLMYPYTGKRERHSSSRSQALLPSIHDTKAHPSGTAQHSQTLELKPHGLSLQSARTKLLLSTKSSIKLIQNPAKCTVIQATPWSMLPWEAKEADCPTVTATACS